MTDDNTESPLSARPPIPAMAMGFVHAVAGGMLALIAAAYGGLAVLMVGYSFLQGQSTPLGELGVGYDLLSLFILFCLGSCTLASGLYLLAGHPRGRRWTMVLAWMGILCALALIAWALANAGGLPTPNALVARSFELGFMTYCLFVLVVMRRPSIRHFYATPEQTTETEDSAA